MPRRVPSPLLALIGALMVLAVVWVNGAPSVFTDTDDYFVHGSQIAQNIKWSVIGWDKNQPETPQEWADRKAQQADVHFAHTSMGARSPYYGMFLWVMQRLGTLWLLAAAQAAVVAWLVALAWRSMAPKAPAWSYCVLMAALAGLTTLPFIAGFALPDIFAAGACLAIALLVVYRDQLRRWEQAGVLAILVGAMAFHTSHLLLVAVMTPVALLLAWGLKADRRKLAVSAAILVGAVVCAAALVAGFSAGVKLTTGDDFGRPPFLTARVIADGPGRDYLRWSCAHGGKWAMCRFRNLPLTSSEDIIWSDKPEKGAFNRASYNERVMMNRQDMPFALATFAYDPVGQTEASLRNWGLQLIRIRADDMLLDPSVYFRSDYWKTTNLIPMIRAVAPCTARGGCKPRFSVPVLEVIDTTFVFVAIAMILWRLARGDVRRAIAGRQVEWDAPLTRLVAASLLIIAAVIVNAAVCGVFSIPVARYQARVIWLIPALACVLGLNLVTERRWAKMRVTIPQAWIQRARPLTGLIEPAFLRYGMVGAAGFAIDGLILHGGVRAGLNYFTARLVSFSIAVVCTWLLNRSFTFRTPSAHGKAKEAALYVAVQCAGGAANIGVYTAAVMLVPALKDWLLVPLAMGSAAGLCLTYLGAKHLAFRERRPDPAASLADA
jgi:putative flippase GtrA